MIESRSPRSLGYLGRGYERASGFIKPSPYFSPSFNTSILSFTIEGNAIRVHPLLYAQHIMLISMDQMAVHKPLSVEAIMEVSFLMMATHNIFSPSSGKPILTPSSQDIVLGSYFLTMNPKNEVKDGQNYL